MIIVEYKGRVYRSIRRLFTDIGMGKKYKSFIQWRIRGRLDLDIDKCIDCYLYRDLSEITQRIPNKVRFNKRYYSSIKEIFESIEVLNGKYKAYMLWSYRYKERLKGLSVDEKISRYYASINLRNCVIYHDKPYDTLKDVFKMLRLDNYYGYFVYWRHIRKDLKLTNEEYIDRFIEEYKGGVLKNDSLLQRQEISND